MGIKARDVAFVRVEAPDLDEMERFLVTFGMTRADRTEDRLYMRGTNDVGYVHVTQPGDNPRVIGFSFKANSVEDVEELAASEGWSPISQLDGPGGGVVTTSSDPDGFQIEVVAGAESVGRLPSFEFPTYNDGREYRRKGEPLRLDPAPSHVKRLGHCLITVEDFAVSKAWYADNLGLVVSDEVRDDDGKVMGAFLRCDQGKMYVDHHTLGVIGSGTSGFNHCAFEVPGFDDLMLGNAVLKQAGYDHQMGIGRHLLGSQIFDYWRDPWGHVLEHWTDGDLFNSDDAPNQATMAELLGDQWGPENTFKHVNVG